MTRTLLFLALVVCLPAWPQTASLNGTVTDPSGAAVPGATVQLRGRGDRRVRTDQGGRYAFSSVPAGKYQVRVAAKGFAGVQTNDFAIDRPAVFDIRLTIQSEKQVITVEDQGRGVSAEPEANGGALVLRARQIAALSDDPDELAMQLQALAGPAPGPNGGQTFIDGFTGGNLPPKSAIREVRVNSNPFSPEYDRPGFARVEIFTKPGSESIHGQAFAQFNDRLLNSRNPLLGESAPFRTRFYGLNLSGPVRRNRASFTMGMERRGIDENGVVLATVLDGGLNAVTINQASPRPQVRTNISPRLDYALSPKNTLAMRYLELRARLDRQGVGDFNLPSRAYDEKQSEHTAQVTETAMLSPRAISETRFQFQRAVTREKGLDNSPAINVQGAFNGGGAISGISGTLTNGWEATNISTFTRRRHTIKWGGRVRQAFLTDTSRFNFAGVYTFYTLEQYRETLAGVSGAGPATFRLNAGTPETHVTQTDAGIFLNDDWRLRRNLTVSFGIRYEKQTNLSEQAAWAPRVAVAWGVTKKTVLRAGAGSFYQRVPMSVTLNAQRYDGTTQQSYLILNPTFFPSIPSAAALEAGRRPQQLQPVASGLNAPRIYQASIGIEHQISQASRVTLTWIGSRGVHLLNVRNINTPIAGGYPYGDQSIRLLTESAGLSRQNQAIANININQKRMFLFGYYALSYGRDNNEGLPANPYDLSAEWGPSAYADLRHKVVVGTSIPILAKITVSPFFAANSGQPYNITTGLDPDNTGYPAARPALLPGCGPRNSANAGCFQVQPPRGTPTIGHNFARGPGAVNLALRVSRTWSFGPEGRTGPPLPDSGTHESGAAGDRRYSLTATVSTLNALNHPNFAAPSGNLTSPYFGQYRALGGFIVMAHDGTPSSYNRKVDLQVRLTF